MLLARFLGASTLFPVEKRVFTISLTSIGAESRNQTDRVSCSKVGEATAPSILSALVLSIVTVLSLWAGSAGAELAQTPSTGVTIQVPVLVNPVIFDGRISNVNEWVDASRSSLNLTCHTVSCNDATVDEAQAVIRTKHDDKWIYFLYEVNFTPKQFAPPCQDDKCPKAFVQYCWSSTGRPPYPECDKANIGIDASGDSYVDDLTCVGGCMSSDTDHPGGQRNVVGIARYDGAFSYFFEFRKMLDSGDGYDWSLLSGHVYGIAGTDGLVTIAFGQADYRPMYGYNVALSLCPCAPAVTSTASSLSTSLATSSSVLAGQTSTLSTQKSEGQALFVQVPLNLSVLGILALAGIVATIAVVMRRRKPPGQVILLPVAKAKAVPRAEFGISTGYSDLDRLLAGGMPEGYAILILSASWDERNLLIRRIIESFIESGRPAFYISNDISTTQELARTHPKDLYAYSAFADKMTSPHGNLRQIPQVGNLSEFSISLGSTLKETQTRKDANKLLILDVLSDVLMRHKTLTTVRWLSDFVARRKVEKFTIIAALNPSIAPKEETQPIFDLFDGVIEIYEKALGERTRRFLVIKKMHGRRYIDEDLMLDRDRLY